MNGPWVKEALKLWLCCGVPGCLAGALGYWCVARPAVTSDYVLGQVFTLLVMLVFAVLLVRMRGGR